MGNGCIQWPDIHRAPCPTAGGSCRNLCTPFQTGGCAGTAGVKRTGCETVDSRNETEAKSGTAGQERSVKVAGLNRIPSTISRKPSRWWMPSPEWQEVRSNGGLAQRLLPPCPHHHVHHLVKGAPIKPGPLIHLILFPGFRYLAEHGTRSLVKALTF